jgi:hypothetical protein
MRGTVILSIAVLVAVAAANESDMFSVHGTGADLVEMPAFAMLANKAHLSYLNAKSFAVKNSEASLVQQAADSCHAARAAHFQMCAQKYLEHQGAKEASKLDFAVFLETPTFALVEDQSKLQATCEVHINAAFAQCRDAFLHSKKPSHQMLMQITDVNDFVKLAGTYSKDGHSHVMESFLQATMGAGSGSGSGSGMGPGPSKTTIDEKKDKTVTEQFRDMEAANQKVEQDEAELPTEPIPHPDKPPEKSDLELAVERCGQLKADTFKHCEKLMCGYHKKCGSKSAISQCKDHERLDKIDARHKESSEKLGRRMQFIKKQQAKELKVKAPELKTKASEKKAKWIKNSPERATKKVESKEIGEKSKALVDKWVPGGYKLAKNNPFKITSQRKGDRRLLSDVAPLPALPPLINDAEAAPYQVDSAAPGNFMGVGVGSGLNAEAVISQLKAKHDAAAEAAAAAKKLIDSPMCKAMASNAFDECETLTSHAYDVCTDELSKADADFVAAMKKAKAIEDAKAAGLPLPGATPPAPVYGSGSGSAAVAVAKVAAKVAKIAKFGAKVATVEKEVPAPAGQTKPVQNVATKVAAVHENGAVAAHDMAKSMDEQAEGKYPSSTKEALKAVKKAEANVVAQKGVADADLKAASKEAKGTSEEELYQQQMDLYNEELEDPSDEVLVKRAEDVFEEDTIVEEY